MKCAICGKEVVSDYPCKCSECKTILCDGCAVKHNFICLVCGGGDDEQKSKSEVKHVKEIRRSYIELYKKCPYSFYLQVCRGMVADNNIYAEIGIFLHDLFDRDSCAGCEGGKTEDERQAECIQSFNEFYESINKERFEGCQYKLPTSVFRESLYKKGLSSIDNYFGMCYNMPSPWKTEERVKLEIPNTKLKATMAYDRINKNADGTFDLIDYKTGGVYVGQKLNTDLQPALYIKGVEEAYDIQINRFIFLFVSEGKERIFQRVSDDKFICRVRNKEYSFSINEKLEEVSKIFKSIEKENFEIPDDLNTYYCENMCSMYKQGHCQGRFSVKWKQALN